MKQGLQGLQQAPGKGLSSRSADWWEEGKGSAWDSDGGGGDGKKRTKQRMKYKEYDDADVSQRPLFTCQTGKKTATLYPQQIQERLRIAWEEVRKQEGAQEEDYEMADEWAIRFRLFPKDEYDEHWKETLRKHAREGNGGVVGAQWNSSFGGQPPKSWDDMATYRPIHVAPEDR